MSKIIGVTVGTPMSLSRIKREIEPDIKNHEDNKKNPHGVTKTQVGLGNVDNTSDMDKPVSTAQATAIAEAKSEVMTAADNAHTAADNAMTAAGNAQTRAETAEANAKAYADARHFNGEVTLTASGWSNNTQTVSFPGVTADGSLTDIYASPRPDDENYTTYTENGVRLYAQGENTLTFKCEDVPGVNVYVNISVEFVGSYVPSGGDLPAWEGGSY